MKTKQLLSTGLHIRQDFTDSGRLIMFETEYEGWRLATDGGNLFLLNVNNTIFGITAKHNKGSFEWDKLVVTGRKLGKIEDQIAHITSLYYPSKPRLEAVGTDVEDIVVLKFQEGIDFFKDDPYIIDNKTIGRSNKDDVLLVHGSLKEHASLSGDIIETAFSDLELQDDGQSSFDVTLRKAIAKFDNPKITSVTGLSGSPVFNKTQNKLVGMVLRGSIDQHQYCILHYIEIFDVMAFIDAIVRGDKDTSYKKPLKK